MAERIATYAFGPGLIGAGPDWRQSGPSLLERPLEQRLAVPLAAMNTIVPTGSLSLAALGGAEAVDFEAQLHVFAQALGRFRVERAGQLRTRAGLDGTFQDVAFDASPSHAVTQRWLQLASPSGVGVVLLGTAPARNARARDGVLQRMMESFRFS